MISSAGANVSFVLAQKKGGSDHKDIMKWETNKQKKNDANFFLDVH